MISFKQNSQIKKAILIMLVSFVVLVPIAVLAQTNSNWGLNNLPVNLGKRDLIDIIGSIVNIVLGVLGIIAFLILLYGGFLWMTSKGDEKKIAKAKRILIDGAIGLAIVLASWAIAAFVLRQLGISTGLINNTNGTGGTGGSGNPNASYLVIRSRYPSTADPVARNTQISVYFNQNLNCATVNNNTVVLTRGAIPVTNVHLRCEGRALTIKSAGDCPAPLNQFQVPNDPNECQNPPAPPGTQNSCFIPEARQGTTNQCQAQTPPLVSLSACPGLSGCGCFEAGSYTLLLKGGSTGDYLMGTRSSGNTMARDETFTINIDNSVDTQAPQITDVSPDPNTNNVVRNRNITITFSKAVDMGTVKIFNTNPTDSSQVSDANQATVLIRSGGNAINGKVVGMTPTSIRWKPTDVCGGGAPPACGCMPANAQIEVIIKDGANGIKGANCMALDTSAGPSGVSCTANDNCTYSFRTSNDVDFTPPQLDTNNVYPASNATDADRALRVGSSYPDPWRGRAWAVFNEDMSVDSVDETTFTMTNDVPTFSVDPYLTSETQFGLKPGAEVLAPNRTYLPSVYGGGPVCSDDAWGVMDAAGNALQGRERWIFKTGESINGGEPLITRVSPSTGPEGQCVTILGYNLGCFNGVGDGNARSGIWQGGSCLAAPYDGKITITGSSGPIDVPNSDIIHWKEVSRPAACTPGVNCPSSCQSATCDNTCGSCELVPSPQSGQCQCPLPVNYSTHNEILISIPQGAQNVNPSTPAEVTVYPPFTSP